MKVNKQAMSLCAALVGAVVFTTAATADVMLGSGYGGAKEVLKTTAAYLEEEADNYTVNGMFSLKVDGRTYTQSNLRLKIDNRGVMREGTENYVEPNGEAGERRYYKDRERYISYDESQELYNVYLQDKKTDDSDIVIQNPFAEEDVQDLEKIADALAGSMKDIIQAENTDNGHLYTGSMCDAQVPALVNAVGSFLLKKSIFSDYMWEESSFPDIQTEIFLHEASGKMQADDKGILEQAMGLITFSGKTKDGAEHTVYFEMSCSLSDINQTTVTAPTLTDENSVIQNSFMSGLDEQYIGTYKNDIVMQQNNGFIKIGERILTITSAQNGAACGSYTEVYRAGYEREALSFDFVPSDDTHGYGDAEISYSVNGESRIGILNINGDSQQNIRFTPNVSFHGVDQGYQSEWPEAFDGEFIRCLD